MTFKEMLDAAANDPDKVKALMEEFHEWEQKFLSRFHVLYQDCERMDPTGTWAPAFAGALLQMVDNVFATQELQLQFVTNVTELWNMHLQCAKCGQIQKLPAQHTPQITQLPPDRVC